MKTEWTAPVFNIVHGSLVDGWGVRTTVFLKGCPLRCLWCCNPEGQKLCNELQYTAEDCNGCGRCIDVCPKQAITADRPGGIPVIDRDICDNCFACVADCPTGALDRFAKVYTVEELYKELIKDEGYFGSDGGVTIGGGEASMHGRFTLELIKKLQRDYIHVALDTCGYITSQEGLAAFDTADLVLFDIKGMDDALHKEATGVSNKLIHENLMRRNASGKDIIIRLPIIPGYSDSSENIRQTAELLAPLKAVKRVDVLLMHTYSGLKYRQLGIPMPAVFEETLPEEKGQEILDCFAAYGLQAQLGG